MLPRWHILWGAVFSALVGWIFPGTAWYNIALIFFGAVFIDFDHYMCAVLKTGKLSLLEAFEYHKRLGKKTSSERKRGIFGKGDFYIFHTVEFNALVLALGFVFSPFWYILIGMVFHSILDFVYLADKGSLYRREFFLTNWIRRKCAK